MPWATEVAGQRRISSSTNICGLRTWRSIADKIPGGGFWGFWSVLINYETGCSLDLYQVDQQGAYGNTSYKVAQFSGSNAYDESILGNPNWMSFHLPSLIWWSGRIASHQETQGTGLLWCDHGLSNVHDAIVFSSADYNLARLQSHGQPTNRGCLQEPRIWHTDN
jgi:hypothetical protein